MPMSECVLGPRFRFARPRIGRCERSRDRASQRKQDDEARGPRGRADQAVARILHPCTHPPDREQGAKPECCPPERSSSHGERRRRGPRDREVVAEQAGVHGLGKQRPHVEYEERTCSVVEVAEREVQQECAERGEDAQ